MKEAAAGETVTLGDNGTAVSAVHYTVLAQLQNSDHSMLVPGDADCSGKVDVLDAVMLARVAAEDTNSGITAQGKRNADCDQNGSIQSADLTLLLRFLAGLTNELVIKS